MRRPTWPWSRSKQELSDELDAHLCMSIEDCIARGEDPSEARRSALRELGNLPLIQDIARESRGWVWLENVFQDTRFALRQLRRSPGSTITVLLTLALGIGANLAVFQLLHSAVLAQLPVAHPEELVTVHAAQTPFDRAWFVSYAAYHRLRASTGSQAPLLALTAFERAILQLPNQSPARTNCQLVSDNYFQVLGVSPAAGRLFVQDDARSGQDEWPAVVRYGFARDYFSSVQQAVGRHILLNGVPVVIIGVAAPNFLGVATGYAPDFWLPLEAQSTGHINIAFDSLGPGHDVKLSSPWQDQPSIFWLSLMARVPSDRRNQVAAQWTAAFQSDRLLMSTATVDPAAKSAQLRGHVQLISANHGQGGIRQESSQPLALLMALSVSVFIVGCLNLANLQIARLSAREQELSIRVALGASRWRLLRQVIMEDALLVLLGGVFAFFVGRATSSALVRWASSRDWFLNLDLHLHLPIAALGAALMLIALLAFSILPALHFIRTGLSHVAGSRAKVSGLVQSRIQRWRSNTMLAAQVSLSLLLATMAGCFAATLVHWEKIDVGMDREHILSIALDMNRTGYASRQTNLPALYHQIKEQLESVPEVRAAAVEMCPMPDCGWNTALYVFGHGGLSNAQLHGEEDHVGPGFFAAMGIPLLRGRDFSTTDRGNTQPVAILNHSYARQLFGDESPIGHRVGYEPAPNDHKFLVIGEAADARLDGARYDPPSQVYMTLDQNPAPIHTIQVRAVGDPRQITERIRQTLNLIDPQLPVTEIITLSDELNDGLGTEKLLTRLAGIYAGLRLLLVTIGFYGVLSFRTARRKTEFGIRLALGATRRHIQLLITLQTAWILLAGTIPGLLLSTAVIHLTRHLLYGSVTTDSFALITATIILVVAGFGAASLPARRAALADPLETLRLE